MLLISKSEQQFILDSLRSSQRIDGRNLTSFRPIELSLNNLPQADGSCQLRLADQSVDILVGTKAEIRQINPNVVHEESLVNYSIRFLHDASSGREQERKILNIRKCLEKLITPAIPKEQFNLVEGKLSYYLNVDIVIMNDESGSLIDFISLAVRAAINSTRTAKVSVVYNQLKEKYETTLLSGEEVDFDDQILKFNARDVPIIVSIGYAADNILVDMLRTEELSVDSIMQCAIDAEGKLCGVYKAGACGVPLSKIQDIFSLAKLVAVKLIEKQNEAFETLAISSWLV